jgi:hypothetical protein
MISRKQTSRQSALRSAKPSYFLSFSTGEAHIELFAECLELVFGNYFTLKRTPDILQSDGSQHDSIFDMVQKCVFGVVCLDGLRPNVLFEYGIMRGAQLPILLFKEEAATVDVAHFYASDFAVAAALPPRPKIDVSRLFSDIQDRHYVGWSRYQIAQTMTTIWQQYEKKKAGIKGAVHVPKPGKASD